MDSKRRSSLFRLTAGLLGALGARAIIRRGRELSLTGRTVLVTGGSRGLGLVLARQLAREGARVVICARDEEELERAHDDLIRRGGEVLAIPCDVTDQAQVEAMVREVEARFGSIHVLINNAGVIEVGPLEEMTLEDYDEAMKTHFWAPLYTTFAVLPAMKQHHFGRIVNISSIGGRVSVPHMLPYSASKFALAGFSEGLRAALVKDNIRVTSVYPGLMRTGSPRNAVFKGQHRAEFAWFSIGDSLPFLTIDAERAAAKIVRALKRGDPDLVVSMAAKAAIRFHDLFPGLTADIAALANRLLPSPGGIGERRAKGSESFSPVSPSWLTLLSDRAALRNNEVV